MFNLNGSEAMQYLRDNPNSEVIWETSDNRLCSTEEVVVIERTLKYHPNKKFMSGESR